MAKWNKAMTILMAGILLLLPALELSASSLSEAQQEKAALEAELKEAQDLIEGIKASKEGIESKVRQLDARLTEIEGRILSLEEKLAQTNVQIENTKAELEEAQADEDIQYGRMKSRIKYMYENGDSMSMLEVLLSSGSIAEFISQAEYIQQITNYDRDMLKKYQQTKQAVKNAKEELEANYRELEELKAQVQQEKDAIQLLLAAKEEELSALQGELSAAQSEADALMAEIRAQDEIIAQIRAIEAQKEKERQDSPNETHGSGAFLWPCPSSKRITSEFGIRPSPTAGASTNHKGIDIGAAYGSAIVAAADGSVSYAGYNSGLGNYVMLSHGNSLYTVYGHCSALLVSTGDTVTAGETIAQVGSTGISTGNHLHFGVSKGGTYVSPWDYLSK